MLPIDSKPDSVSPCASAAGVARHCVAAVLVVTMGIGAALTSTAAGAVVRELDRIVAVVEDDVVLGSELITRLSTVREQMAAAQIEPPPNEVLLNQILERLILESVQLQEAARRGIEIDDESLTQAVAAFAQQNRMSLAQFRQALAADGVAYGEFREQIRREMIITRVQRALVNRRIQISEQDVQAIIDSPYYEALLSDEFRVGHILLEIAEDASEETRQRAATRAAELVTQLRAGGDFGPLAVANSAGARALEGGDMGWRRAGELPSLFSERVLAMSPGDTSEPIKSGRGLHIIQLLDRRGAGMEEQQQTRSRHILMQASEIRTEAQTKAAIEEVYAELMAGGDFAALAKEHSEDPGSALKGGDLGWSTSTDFVPAFAAMVDSAELDVISKPFRSKYGWHILQVQERRVEDMSAEALQNKAAQILHKQRFEDELEKWLKEIRDEAYVEMRLQGAAR